MAGRPEGSDGLRCCVCPAIGPKASSRAMALKLAREDGWARNHHGWRCPVCRSKGLVYRGWEPKPPTIYKLYCSDCSAVGPEGIGAMAVQQTARNKGWAISHDRKTFRCPGCKADHRNGWARGSSLHLNCSPQLYKLLDEERAVRGQSLVSQAMRSVLAEHYGMTEEEAKQ